MKMNPEIFREYDIRGVYDRDFNDSFAYTLAKAYAVYCRERGAPEKMVFSVGHDARLSSPSIAKAVTKGLVESGAEVIELGLITTPISYFSTFHFTDLTGAFMITGSHNPPDYNGFKISYAKSTIFGEEIKRLFHIIQEGSFLTSQGSSRSYDILSPYVEHYKNEFKNIGNVPVVLDCGNGAAGSIVRRLYESLGLKPTILFEEPDGKFPNHHPDPTVEENLVHLKNKVLETKSKLGIGFDGDADRIGLVDESGKMIFGDELMVLVSRSILEEQPGATIIGDVKCSDRLYHDIQSRGGRAIMWKTGHSLIKDKIKKEGAPFGGEMSGHIFFADRNYGYDDALYAGLRVIEILSKSNKTITQLLSGLPPAFNTPEIRIDTTEEKKRSIVQFLINEYNKPSDRYKVNLIDGVRISFENGWALARASNTQPVLVLRFESDTENGLKEIRNEIESKVKSLL